MEPEPGEQVFFHGHPSWRSILGFFAKGFVLIVLAGALAGVITAIGTNGVEVGWIVLVVLAGFAIALGAGVLKLVRTTYTITNQRLVIDSGMLTRELHQTRLARVQNVNCRQSLLERLLRVGTVDFDTAGEAGYDFSFGGVSDPRAIVRTVDRALSGFQHTGAGV